MGDRTELYEEPRRVGRGKVLKPTLHYSVRNSVKS